MYIFMFICMYPCILCCLVSSCTAGVALQNIIRFSSRSKSCQQFVSCLLWLSEQELYEARKMFNVVFALYLFILFSFVYLYLVYCDLWMRRGKAYALMYFLIRKENSYISHCEELCLYAYFVQGFVSGNCILFICLFIYYFMQRLGSIYKVDAYEYYVGKWERRLQIEGCHEI